MKFAFIARYEGLEDEYKAVCDNGSDYNEFIGVDSIEAGKDLVVELEKEGYDLVNLCGDFDADITADIAAATEGKIEICHSDYLPEEMAKIEKLESLDEYGVIIIDDTLDGVEYREIKSEFGNTYIKFIQDLDGACQAAKELVDGGVYFIELCSWFDKEKTEAVIAAIDGAVPVGSCGEL